MIKIGSISLTDGQKDAVFDIKKWFKSDDQVYTLAGYAGTGKSTLVNYFLDEMKIGKLSYVTCAFTGKASLNLIKKGVPSQTIHKLAYDLVHNKETKRREWVKKDKIVNQDSLKLLVIDEISMVNKQLLDDLLSFGIKVIALGDPGQLPAIGQANTLLNSPNYFLEEIMRQAESNPIIYLSMLARRKKNIDLGAYQDTISGKTKVFVIDKSERSANMLLKTDQIVCGTNATRNILNDEMRAIIFETDRYLPVKGDKLICTSNNWQESLVSGTPLVNGLMGYSGNTVYDVDFEYDKFKLDFIEDIHYQEGNDKYNSKFINRIDASVSELLFNSGALERPKEYRDTERFVRMANKELSNTGMYEESEDSYSKVVGLDGLKLGGEFSKLNKFDYGYAITCNKAQGSQFDKLYAIEEVLRSDMHHRWLYTLITRAKDRLILEKRENKRYSYGRRW